MNSQACVLPFRHVQLLASMRRRGGCPCVEPRLQQDAYGDAKFPGNDFSYAATFHRVSGARNVSAGVYQAETICGPTSPECIRTLPFR